MKLLGRGGFGKVYLARDDKLGRPVAIKVPHPGLFRTPGQLEQFQAEARIAAGLKHHAIVQVYDVGDHDQEAGEPFVVFEYIEGRNLSELFRAARFSPARIAGLMIHIAEAAQFAHRAGLVHRDLKPSNILIDGQGQPHIADFGLAVREDLQRLRTGEIAGTPSYMAPEQIRGETHRLDARTDVWAMGVILYLGLGRRLPFPARRREELFRSILEADPKPPHQIDKSIPRELERICLKCLSKRMDDRYETAAELVDDLRNWLATLGPPDVGESADSSGPSSLRIAALGPPRIVPKGLRSFDAEDADFFITLVPGPWDRHGLPESIRAWKRRIEESDPARSFAVGLIYGPSGGGKSSFVKAGLLPRLASHVRPAFVEASANDTETRLLNALRRAYPDLPASCGLAEAAAAIREGSTARPGSKVLIVLDQFEQWLQGHPSETDGELVRALRHCDGLGLQAILLVRDDYWMAITRFLRALEVRPVEGVNSSAVEQFDPQHAKRVLGEIGRALGRLPNEASPEQLQFLEEAVTELVALDGRVIPVRLTLFVETLRRRNWSSATLQELGGLEGSGVMFLEETFAASTAPPTHRVHQRAAQAVLRTLLPDPSSNLKGRLRPASVLRESAGYSDRPDEFAELIAILDNELRMVSAVNPSSIEVEGDRRPGDGPESRGETYYQLTHDFLVPPIRRWLIRKERETGRGRAERLLAETTAFWRDRPARRRLPSFLEWLRILGFTSRRNWSSDEHRMMRAATRYYLTGAAVAIVIGVALGSWARSARDREQANAWLGRVLVADYNRLAVILPEFDTYREPLRPRLEALETGEKGVPHHHHVAAVLLYHDRPTPDRAAALRTRLVSAPPSEVVVISDALATHPELAGIGELHRVLEDKSAESGARLRAACVLAAIEPGFASGLDAERLGRSADRSFTDGTPGDPHTLVCAARTGRPASGSPDR